MTDGSALSPPSVTLAALAGEAAALEDYLAGLSETDLERPSACSE